MKRLLLVGLWLATLSLFLGCAKGGDVKFMLPADGDSTAISLNKSMVIGQGGRSYWYEEGVAHGSGYSGQILIKSDSGVVHSASGYKMSMNLVQIR